MVECSVRRRKGCSSLVNAAYGLQIPFKLDFTRFLRICAPTKKQKLANFHIFLPKHGNIGKIIGVERLSDISNHYLLTRGY